MPLPTSPTRVIVPIVTVTEGTIMAHELWGTAFMVGPNIIMSARHVLDVEVPEGQVLAALVLADEIETVPLTDLYLDPTYDIALAKVPTWPLDEYLEITPDDTIAYNAGVLCVEYSPTEMNAPMPDGRSAMHLSANHHQGHLVRDYMSDFGHSRPARTADVSFPAFKRASGAPLVKAQSGEVVGMLVSNVERHLMPAHVERVERSDHAVEEVRYFLPQGQAILASHLRDALTDAKEAWG